MALPQSTACSLVGWLECHRRTFCSPRWDGCWAFRLFNVQEYHQSAEREIDAWRISAGSWELGAGIYGGPLLASVCSSLMQSVEAHEVLWSFDGLTGSETLKNDGIDQLIARSMKWSPQSASCWGMEKLGWFSRCLVSVAFQSHNLRSTLIPKSWHLDSGSGVLVPLCNTSNIGACRILDPPQPTIAWFSQVPDDHDLSSISGHGDGQESTTEWFSHFNVAQ